MKGTLLARNKKLSLDPLVILIAGQSNGVAPSMYSTDDSFSETGKVAIATDWDGTLPVVPDEENKRQDSATWLRFGDHIARWTGREVKVINVAIGATMSSQWASTYYTHITEGIQNWNPAFILWIQGEQDVLGIPSVAAPLTQQQTYDNYRTIMNYVRAVDPDVPFYCALDGLLQAWSGVPLANNTARLAQAQIIAEGHMLQGVDIDLMRTVHPELFEPAIIHFTGHGFDYHAQQWINLLGADILRS